MENITEKVRNNAIISYLFILVNISFLTNKNKININNDFVKNHTKTAILIHLWFLLNAIIFAYFWLWFNAQILGYSISDVIAISIFLALFWLLIIWMYKAYNLKTFKIWETLNYKNDKKILDISSDWKFSEKDKLTIMFSKIPFIWFLIYPKYRNNKLIESTTKLNLVFSLIFISLYSFWNPNLANLLLLTYIIFSVFTVFILFIKDEVININLDFLPNAKLISNHIKTISIYMWNYLWNKKEFPAYSKILEAEIKESNIKNIESEKELNTKYRFKLNDFIIYVPFINFIALFNLNTSRKKHIINWVLISLTLIMLILIFWKTSKYLLFMLFPIFFWLWYLKAWIMNYETPILYNIYIYYSKLKNKIKDIFKKVEKIKNTETEVSLKVWENKKDMDIKNTKKTV